MSAFTFKKCPFFVERRISNMIISPFYGLSQAPHTSVIKVKNHHQACKNKKTLYLRSFSLPTCRRMRIINGEMAEWSIAAVLKTVVRVTGPGVRIPLSPQSRSLPSAVTDGIFI
jgi:hypothetical protein